MLDQCPALPRAAGAPLKLATLSFTSKLVPRLQTLSIFTAPAIAELSPPGMHPLPVSLSVCPPNVQCSYGAILMTKWLQCSVM